MNNKENLRRQLAVKELEIELLKKKLDAVYSSRSWRMTRVLRLMSCLCYFLFLDKDSVLYVEARGKLKRFVIRCRDLIINKRPVGKVFLMALNLVPELKSRLLLMEENTEAMRGGSETVVLELSEASAKVYRQLKQVLIYDEDIS